MIQLARATFILAGCMIGCVEKEPIEHDSDDSTGSFGTWIEPSIAYASTNEREDSMASGAARGSGGSEGVGGALGSGGTGGNPVVGSGGGRSQK